MDEASLRTDDLQVLLSCQLERAFGQTPGIIQHTQVRFQRGHIYSEAILDLAKIPPQMTEIRGYATAVPIAQIALKVRKIPLLGQQKLFFAVYGMPIVKNRNFVLHSQPRIQVGSWQFTPQKIDQMFRIPQNYLQEWLEQEHRGLPMEPQSIFIQGDRLELRGSKTAW